jgi:hypothetical protein
MIDHDSLTVISVDIHGAKLLGIGQRKTHLQPKSSLGRIDNGVTDEVRTHNNRNHNSFQNIKSIRVFSEFFEIYSEVSSTI